MGGVARRPQPAASIPLARLMAMGFRSIIDALHRRLPERGWTDIRPAFGFVLLAARERPTAITDIAALLGVTKQAASKLADALGAAGYIRREPSPDDARSVILVLTPRGDAFLAAAEAIYDEIEAEWAAVITPAGLRAMKRDLAAALLALHDGRLPAVRPTW